MESGEAVGRISKQFGLEGELIINLYDTFPEVPDMEEPLFADIDSLTVPLFLEKFERRGQRSALVRFSDFDSNARTAELLGRELFAASADDEQDDENIYMEDLVGFAVSFDDSPLQGTITDFIDNDLNPLFEITAAGREIYVPATDDMISALDIEKKEIEFSLPQGLLELYL